MKKESLNSMLKFDNKVSENIYLTIGVKNVMKNISTFEIDIQVPTIKNEIGVRYSRKDEVMVITICFIDGKKRRLIQFIVLQGCDKNEVYQNKFDVFKGLHDVVIKGIDIVNSETVQDLIDISVG